MSDGPPAEDVGMTDRSYSPIAPDNYSGDTRYGEELAKYTISVASSVEDYKFTNGRRYHSYKEGSYVFPNDQKEADRLDMMHHLLQLALDGALHLSPVVKPKRVLDLGTGTGVWAMQFGDDNPESDVIGNDLSPIQPKWVPDNVHFEVDDVEAIWVYPFKFDFIHCRSLYGAIKDWPTLVKNCYEFTAPGGYCEFTDWDVNIVSVDNTLEPGSAIDFQGKEVIRLLHERGLEPSPGPHLERWARDAGFEDIHVKVIPVPLGTWPKDHKLKEVGSWMYLQLVESGDGYINYLFTTDLGWNQTEIEVHNARFREQLRDRRVHALIHAYNVYGRKPL